MKRRGGETCVYFSKFFGSSFLSLFLLFLLQNNKNKNTTNTSLSFLSFFLSLSLLYSAHYVFCGVSSITDDELVFAKKKVFYTTRIRKRERDGRGL